ncbi:MAG: response regulator, partial [Bdellovibrionota bacterium]
MANILLVDDSTDIRDAVAAVLKTEHEVSWASSLNEAKTLIGDRHYDLVLLDIGLPDGDGMEFLAKMQSDLEGKGTGVIFLSGTNTVPARTRSFSLGALDYIAKPFDIMEFQVRGNAKL